MEAGRGHDNHSQERVDALHARALAADRNALPAYGFILIQCLLTFT